MKFRSQRGIFYGMILFTLMMNKAIAHEPMISDATISDPVAKYSMARAHYLGNEGVMIQHQSMKLLFDPFFHNNYGIYSLVPKTIRESIFANKAPYNDIHAIFISHAHGDHFDAEDVLSYLIRYEKVLLIAPKQAVDSLKPLQGYSGVSNRIHSVHLLISDKPLTFTIGELTIDAIRIPHAGWPGRAEVQNIVFRVNSSDGMTVMHLGDADANEEHYLPFQPFWQSKRTDVAFPPYWFGLSQKGNRILETIINVERVIGVHVPEDVPQNLKQSSMKYFSKPGEIELVTIEK